MRQERTTQPTPLWIQLWFAALLVMLTFVMTGSAGAATATVDEDDDAKASAASSSEKKIVVIKSRGKGRLGVSKAELSRRPRAAGEEALPSRRALPTTSDPVPTVLKLTFPTLVDPGQDVRGTLKFNDPDDYVYGIFITVFFPDGDVVTEPLYYYPDDGGDIWKGTIRFWVEMPYSETPLTGRIVITCSDEYLNVSEISQNYALFY